MPAATIKQVLGHNSHVERTVRNAVPGMLKSGDPGKVARPEPDCNMPSNFSSHAPNVACTSTLLRCI